MQTRTVIGSTPDECRPGNPVTVRECPTYDVGVLAGSTACAGGASPILLRLDNENNHGDTPPGIDARMSGWTGASYVDGIKNTYMYFCRADGLKFKPLIDSSGGALVAYEYAVLKLGTTCPNGSIEFGRLFDNQDDTATSNPDTAVLMGSIAPGYIDGNANAMLRFCLFRYASTPDGVMQQEPGAQNQFPLLGYSYGVFAPETFVGSALGAKGFIITDDENDDTASRLDIPSTLDVSAVRNIIDGYPYTPPPEPYVGPRNTIMRTCLASYW